MELEKISIDELRYLIIDHINLILYIGRDQYEYVAENVKDTSRKLQKKLEACREYESLFIRLHWPEIDHMPGNEEGFNFYGGQRFRNYKKCTVVEENKIKIKKREISWKIKDIPILPKKYWIINNG